MDINQLKTLVTIFASLDSNDDRNAEECWHKMTEILSEDVSETIQFFSNACTDEEFYWLSAIFENIAEKTQSVALIQVLRHRLAQVLPESYSQQNFKSEHMKRWVDYSEYVRCIEENINYAEGQLRDLK